MRQHTFTAETVRSRCTHKTSRGRVCGHFRNDARHKKSAMHIPFTARLSSTDEVSQTLSTFEGGATRSVKAERRELMPKSAIDALSRRLALGAERHGVNNWRKGGKEFRLATVNHLLDHIFEYLERGGKENTDAIICNAAFLCEFEEKEPYGGVE